MNLRMPFDSVVVLPRRCGDAIAGVWSEITAEQVGVLLAHDRGLRVVPADRVQSLIDEEERTPEEIGRELSVNAAAVCSITARDSSLDLEVELIDVLGESLIGAQKFLSCVDDAGDLQLQAARAIIKWLKRDARRIEPQNAASGDGTIVGIRVAMRERRFADALQLCRSAPLAKSSATLRLEIARAIVDTPIGSRREDAALAKRAIGNLDRAEADELAARIACRFDRRWKYARKCFEAACTKPDGAHVHAAYAAFLIAMRRFDEARSQIRWVTLERKQVQLKAVLNALFSDDTIRAAEAIRAIGRVTDDAYVRAQRNAMEGRPAAACTALASAIETFSPLVMFMAVDPSLHVLRDSRRFAELLHIVHLG